MINILIVEDQKFAREVLKSFLEPESDLKILKQAETGVQALEYLEELTPIIPDIALVDLQMPEMDGFTLTKILHQRFPETKTIILSALDDKKSIQKAIQMGAKGYLLKTSSKEALVDTIRYVNQGYFQLGPGLFDKLLSSFIEDQEYSLNLNSSLEEKYNEHLLVLKQQIKSQEKRVRDELAMEQQKQINNLELELKQGLEEFQQKVDFQISEGLNALNYQFHNHSLNPKSDEKHIVSYLMSQFTTHKLLIKKLEQEFTWLRYLLVGLGSIYLAEKLAVLIFSH